MTRVKFGKMVDPARHLRQGWRVNTLAPDYKIHDVWQLPIIADPAKGETFHHFFELATENGLESNSSITQFLSWLRAKIGDVLGWEYEDGKGTLPGTNEHTITERLTEEDRRTSKRVGNGEPTVKNSITKLALVYERENEALFEINNKTVSGLFHISFVDTDDGKKTAELAVYAKTRGMLSKAYMLAIDPFRLIAVYPQWISNIGRKWEEWKQNRPHQSSGSAATANN